MTTEIWEEKLRIDKDRRDTMKDLMSDYDINVYWPARKALIERCVKETGHHWRFRDTNPFGYPIFDCIYCGTTEIRTDD